jgi:hypothetical protein
MGIVLDEEGAARYVCLNCGFSDERADTASMLAEELAAGMDEATVEKCRAAALERFELETERT